MNKTWSDHLVQLLSNYPDGIISFNFMSWDLFIVQTNNCSTKRTCYVKRICCEYEVTMSIYWLKIWQLLTL